MLIRTSRFSAAASEPDVKARLDAELRQTMLLIASDALTLCQVVAHGPEHWRQQLKKTFYAAGLPVTDEMADRLFAFFCLRVQQTFTVPAGKVLDAIEIHEPHVPTAREIAESWEIESGSSPEGQAFCYGGRTLDEANAALKGELLATMEEPD